MSELDWERVSSEYGEDIILFRTRFDQMRNPRTRAVLRRLVLESVDWVNMVAITEDEQCVMVRQYRFGTGYATLETPGGMVDPGEDSETAAKRELLEETGYTGEDAELIGTAHPNPAFQGNLCHTCLIRNAVKTGNQDLDEGEDIEVFTASLKEIDKMIDSGAIRNSMIIAAFHFFTKHNMN